MLLHSRAFARYLDMLHAALSLALLVPQFSPLTIQKSQVDITPPEPLPLGGYTARGGKSFEPGGERLYARCLLIKDGRQKLAIVSAEMLTIPESLRAEVQRKIGSGITLFLSATHTHCAPDSQMLNERMTFAIPGIATFRRRWLDWYSDRIASSVKAAIKARSEDFFPCIRQDRLALNRGRRANAQPDQLLTTLAQPLVIMFFSAEQAYDPVPILMSYAAHATFFSSEELHTRGDWPGALANYYESPILQGAIGDVSPDRPGSDAAAKVQAFLTAVRSRVVNPVMFESPVGRLLAEPWTRLDEKLVVAEAPINLLPPKPHPEFATANHIPEVLAQQLVDKFAPREAKVTAFRIGKLAVVGIPGEPTSHLGRKIQNEGKKMGFEYVLVISHVNGWMGYILDSADYDRGGYEATLSFNGREEGNKVVEAAVDALRKLRR